jgi:hypothetical protein
MVADIDADIVGNVREDMLALARRACEDFMTLSDYDATKMEQLTRFDHMMNISNAVKHAYGERAIPHAEMNLVEYDRVTREYK